ncbi:MAG: phosphoglucomutase/phosphomannomutase family protein [Limnochordaceae bacterium]|nr:phosphoglucomutase/phosphomannomutase family protein [Limnochordaceae bacterium]
MTIRFGTDGWRAVIADQFTYHNVRLVTQAIANYLGEAGLGRREILVGYDTRFAAEHFAQEVSRVLAGNSLAVGLTASDVPTPVLAHAVLHRRAAGAIMLTASHNPPQYLGLKFIPEYGGPAQSDVTAAIEEQIVRVQRAEASGNMVVRTLDLEQGRRQGLVDTVDPRIDYVEHLMSVVGTAPLSRGVEVVYDAMYGTGRHYAAEALENLGVRVHRLHDRRDPLFGGGAPEPTAQHLQELIQAVRSRQGALGLATDGDADRFGVVDEDGTYLTPNEVLAIVADYLLGVRQMRGSIVRTVATTHVLDRLAAQFGVTARETPVGFKHVGAWMRRENVTLGGEESGGMSIAGHIPEKDGILAVLLVTRIWAEGGISLRRRLAAIHERVGPATGRRVDMPIASDEVKRRILDHLASQPPDRWAGQRVDKVVVMDGVKVILESGAWWLLRASGTEPLMRLYLEAPDAGLVDGMEREVRQLVARMGA